MKIVNPSNHIFLICEKNGGMIVDITYKIPAAYLNAGG